MIIRDSLPVRSGGHVTNKTSPDTSGRTKNEHMKSPRTMAHPPRMIIGDSLPVRSGGHVTNKTSPDTSGRTKNEHMKEEKIQTLHPVPGKTNKSISVDKYNKVKENILSILQGTELTHTELMEKLFDQKKDDFAGGVQWYGETVKLDLEARKIIERTAAKPARYRLQTNASPAEAKIH